MRFFPVVRSEPFVYLCVCGNNGDSIGRYGASVFIYEKVLVPVLGNYPGSLAYALLYVLFCWSIVHILYKKGIYVKI